MSATINDTIRWTKLQSEDIPLSAPTLFISCSTGNDGYQAVLTDLSNVWVERLQRDDVIKRAQEIKTTIDPNESPSQYLLFLQTIKDGLVGQPFTTFWLATEPASQDVVMQLTCRLPPPLRTLTWRVHFKLAMHEGIKKAIVMPLFKVTLLESRKGRELQSEIRAKDHIIGKLLDAIEAVGADLSSIFPGLAGAGITRTEEHRKWLVENVNGMRAFDEDTMFRSKVPALLKLLSDEQIVNEVPVPAEWSSLPENRGGLPKPLWWHQLPPELPEIEEAEDGSSAPGSKKTPGRYKVRFQSIPTSSFYDDTSNTSAGDNASPLDDTPVSARTPGVWRSRSQTLRESGSPSPTSNGSQHMIKPNGTSPPQSNPTRSRRLGKIGGKRAEPDVGGNSKQDQAEQAWQQNPEPAYTTRSQQPLPVPQSAPDVPKTIALSPRRSKVGRIGGRNAKAPALELGLGDPTQDVKMSTAMESDTNDTHQHEEIESTDAGSEQVASSRFRNQGADDGESHGKGGPPIVEEDTNPEESVKQSADHRREKLRRQLETQSTAKPKRRRF